jgi:hypothetical protein
LGWFRQYDSRLIRKRGIELSRAIYLYTTNPRVKKIHYDLKPDIPGLCRAHSGPEPRRMKEYSKLSVRRVWTRTEEMIGQDLSGGAHWFLGASILPSFITLVLAPLIIRKVGLDEYAVLALAIFFLNLANAYSDFSTQTHLLIIFSRKDENRRAAFGNAMLVRFTLLACAFAGFGLTVLIHPRGDSFYPLLLAYMLGIPLSNSLMEWYFIARKRYRQLFMIRLWSAVFLLVATLLWSGFGSASVLYVPLIAAGASGVGCFLILKSLGASKVRLGIDALRAASARPAFKLAISLVPMASTVLFSPYFIAYALPWFTVATDDPTKVGAFSVAYRLVMGFVALAGPLVLYVISSRASQGIRPVFFKALTLSTALSLACWAMGVLVLKAYFIVADIDRLLFPFSLEAFSILMVGFFFLCLRTPYVGRCLALGRYRTFGAVHLASCLPTLALSFWARDAIPGYAVIWLACLPEVLVTGAFLLITRPDSGPVSIS